MPFFVFISTSSWSQNIFNSTGNAGVGTSNPAVLMDLKGNNVSYGGQLRIQAEDYSQITFYNSNYPSTTEANRKGSIFYDHANSDFVVQNFNGGTNGNLLLNPSGGLVHVGSIYQSSSFQVSGLEMDLVKFVGNSADRSGIYGQNINSTGGATIFFDNDRGSFSSYGGFLVGGSGNVAASIFGLSKNDKTFFIADGAHSLGMGVGTITSQPLILGTSNSERLRIDANGNISIGTSNSQGYKFAVDGDAIFTKIKVKTSGNWPDYVFHEKYELLSLNLLEKFIKTYKHLPDVPSAATIEKEGLDISENQAVLLKKIEELTLHLIQQNKKIEEQQRDIELLKKNAQINQRKKG